MTRRIGDDPLVRADEQLPGPVATAGVLLITVVAIAGTFLGIAAIVMAVLAAVGGVPA